MKEEFVPYEIALALKDLGFTESCFAMWTKGWNEFEWSTTMIPRIFSSKFRLNDTQSCNSYVNNADAPFGIAAPTFSQAFYFLRKNYYLYGIVIPTITMNWTFKTMIVVESEVEVPPYKNVHAEDYATHERAELALLKELIKLAEDERRVSKL